MSIFPGADNAELVYQTHPELRNETICKECNRPTAIVEDHKSGDYICGECGLVVGDRVIDLNSEWRTFANDKGEDQGDPSRVGSAVNPLLNGSDLTTSVGAAPGADAKILGRAHARTTANIIDRQLQKSFRAIGEFAERLHLPDAFTMKAKQIFKQMEEYHTKQRGGVANPFGAIVGAKKTEAVAAAALYLACRLQGDSRSYKELAAVSKVRKTEIGQAVKYINATLGFEATVVDITQFVPRICDALNLPRPVMNLASAIASRANADVIDVAGRSPLSIVGAAVFMASHLASDRKSLDELSRVTGQAEQTIRNCYQILHAHRFELVPEASDFRANMESLPVS